MFHCEPSFLTDANMVGVEKIAAAEVPREYLDEEYQELPSTIGGSVRPKVECTGFRCFFLQELPLW